MYMYECGKSASCGERPTQCHPHVKKKCCTSQVSKVGVNEGPRSTFTFICHPGKTHNRRSRGDTSRRAQTAQKIAEGADMHTDGHKYKHK